MGTIGYLSSDEIVVIQRCHICRRFIGDNLVYDCDRDGEQKGKTIKQRQLGSPRNEGLPKPGEDGNIDLFIDVALKILDDISAQLDKTHDDGANGINDSDQNVSSKLFENLASVQRIRVIGEKHNDVGADSVNCLLERANGWLDDVGPSFVKRVARLTSNHS